MSHDDVETLRSRSRDRRGKKFEDDLVPPPPADEEEKSDLTGDWGNVFILLVLYTLQGVPMGLGAAIPMVLQEKGASLADLGTFSLITLPFSLKLLWAPIVDSVYIKSVGLRKTWLIPSQMCIGLAMVLSAPAMDRMIGNEDTAPDVISLTWLFTFFFFMCATQDIAVDGWALTMLKKRNISYASTTNAIGQSLGNALSFVGYLALNHYELADLPLVMQLWGYGFLTVTIAIAVFKREVPEPDTEIPDLKEAYSQMFMVLRCPAVKELILVLMTSKVGYAVGDSLSGVKLQAAGVPKEHLAYMGLLITPVSIFLPGLISKYTSGNRPFDFFVKGVIPRVGAALMAALVISLAPNPWPESIPWTFYAVVFIITTLYTALSTAQFVAQMAFFARVSDPAIGGTYMTMLNTVSNLAFKWPSSLIFFLVEWSTIKDEVTGEVQRDGFYMWSVICAGLAFLWVFSFSGVIERLQTRPLSDWRVMKSGQI